MNPELATLPDLMPALPEILLAVGAMVLLMVGAFGDKRIAQVVNGLAVALLIIAGALLLLSPGGTLVTFSDAFIQDPFARLMKILVLVGSGVALAMSVGFARPRNRELRVSGAGAAGDRGHDVDAVGQ